MAPVATRTRPYETGFPSFPTQPTRNGPAGGSAWRRLTERVERATPAGRERALDAYRALAIAGVVLGHWLVGALVLRPDGALAITSPLRTIDALAPASWFLQMLGLFFLVGGFAAARSLDGALERGDTYATWVRRRAARMARPVLAGLAVSTVALAVLAGVGVPAASMRVWVILFVQPLWVVLVFGLATAITPLTLRLDRRLGLWAPGLLAAVVALGDLLRYGPWQDVVPGWVGLLNIVPGWLFGYQLGVAWAHGRLDRVRWIGWAVLAAGLVAFALLVVQLGYPTSMVGVPGAVRSNANPPSMLVIALAATQAGAAIVARARVERLLRRSSAWTVVALVNATAMTIFCWHQVPLVLVSLGGAAVDGLPGLTDDPTGPAWVLARLPWLVVMAAVLLLLVSATRRFERPWPPLRSGHRLVLGVLVAGFAGWALALY